MFDSIFQDPMVRGALRIGRSPSDIALLECPGCGEVGYYNQGSHFCCRHCDGCWSVCSDDEELPLDGPYLVLDHVLTLQDFIDQADDENQP